MKNTKSRPLERKHLFLVGLIFYFTFVFACRTGGLESHPPLDRHQPYNYVGQKGMVVAAHPLAADAGLSMLKKGGNAVDAAIEAPRFFSYSTLGKAGEISLEARIPESVVESLKELGHVVEVREAYDKYFGGAQGIMILWDKRLIHGGADSRRDGHGAGY